MERDYQILVYGAAPAWSKPISANYAIEALEKWTAALPNGFKTEAPRIVKVVLSGELLEFRYVIGRWIRVSDRALESSP